MGMKMKKITILYYWLALMVLSGCTTDDGNYDYIDPGTVSFFGMTRDTISVIGDRLFIPAVFHTETPEDELDFLWYQWVEDENSNTVADTISREKDLDIINDLGGGSLYFNVYNKAHNVNYAHAIDITIGTPFSFGWAILKDKGGVTDYDFVSDVNFNQLENVLENFSSTGPIQGAPVSMSYFSVNVGTASAGRFYVSTLSILTELDVQVYHHEDISHIIGSVNDFFSNTDLLGSPFMGGDLDGLAAYGTILSGGKLFNREYNLFYDAALGGQVKWSGAPVVSDIGYEIRVPGSLLSSGDSYVFFDELNDQYAYVSGDEILTVKRMKDPEEAGALNPNELQGYDCIWMDRSQTREFRAVFKKEGQYYWHGFSSSFGPAFSLDYQVVVPDGIMNDSSVFTNSYRVSEPSLYTYISNGGTIHRFVNGENPTSVNFQMNYITDYSSETIIEMAVVETFRASEDINPQNLLAIGLEGSNGYRMVVYDVDKSQELASYPVDARIHQIEYIAEVTRS